MKDELERYADLNLKNLNFIPVYNASPRIKLYFVDHLSHQLKGYLKDLEKNIPHKGRLKSYIYLKDESRDDISQLISTEIEKDRDDAFQTNFIEFKIQNFVLDKYFLLDLDNEEREILKIYFEFEADLNLKNLDFKTISKPNSKTKVYCLRNLFYEVKGHL